MNPITVEQIEAATHKLAALARARANRAERIYLPPQFARKRVFAPHDRLALMRASLRVNKAEVAKALGVYRLAVELAEKGQPRIKSVTHDLLAHVYATARMLADAH